MAEKVNSQIIDAVVQTNKAVLGAAPAQAMALLHQTAAHATGLALHNAVTHRQSANLLDTAIVATAIRIATGTSNT